MARAAAKPQKIDPLQRLELMLADMEAAPPLFRPTNFWQSGLSTIVDDIAKRGFERFREHRSARSFYVPTFRNERLERVARPVLALLTAASFLSRGRQVRKILAEGVDGTSDARRRYEIFSASLGGDWPSWSNVSESDIGGGERFTFEGRQYSRSFLNYLLGLSFLHRTTGTKSVDSVLEIGGGYGTLGEIVLKSGGRVYVNVDIPPVAAVSSYYLEAVFGSESVLTYEQSRDLSEIDLDRLPSGCRAAIICPWQLPRLKGGVDLFANFISFQEMEPEIVRNYIRVVSALQPSCVLLRNSRRGQTKAKAAGEVGVVEPVTTDQMIEWFESYSLVGRDSHLFGEESLDGQFWSEVIVMTRQAGADVLK